MGKTKYIVKNCCCFSNVSNGCNIVSFTIPCELNNCTIKQIVEMCKKREDKIPSIRNTDNIDYDWGKLNFAQQILDKLEVEEVKEHK